MNPAQIELATHIMIICLGVLLYTAVRAYYAERERRKYYESRYYSEPRIHHYRKKKGFWIARWLFPIIIIMFSCEKSELPLTKKCYDCEVTVRGIIKAIDTCVDDPRQLDFRNDQGIGLPWSCRERQ